MIAATILLFILTWGVVVFGLRGATTREQVNRTLPALIVFGLLALLTAFFALGDYLDAILPNRLEPIRTAADLAEQQPFEIREQSLIIGETVGLIEYRVSDPMTVRLSDDTTVDISGTAYIASQWDVNDDEAEYLDAGSPLVVLTVAKNETDVVARLVYQGTYDGYIDYIPRFTIMPIITIALSLLLALACFGLPVLARRRLKDT